MTSRLLPEPITVYNGDAYFLAYSGSVQLIDKSGLLLITLEENLSISFVFYDNGENVVKNSVELVWNDDRTAAINHLNWSDSEGLEYSYPLKFAGPQSKNEYTVRAKTQSTRTTRVLDVSIWRKSKI